MSVRIDRNSGWTIVTLSGNLDIQTAPEMQRRLMETLDDSGGSFLIDLENVRALDSSGLAALVRYYKEIRLRGGTLALCAVQRHTLKVFQLTRLDRIFPIFPSSEAARAA